MNQVLSHESVSPTIAADACGPRNVGMFLLTLGVRVCANVISRLTPEELEPVTESIAGLEEKRRLDPQAKREFRLMRSKGQAFAALESDYVLHVVREALKSEARAEEPAALARKDQAGIDRTYSFQSDFLPS